MGYIKEPEGIDFIIQSEPLTNQERKAISEYIANYKVKKNPVSKPINNLRNRKQLV